MANKQKTVNINTIKPNPNNPRQMTSEDFDGLVKSIKRDPQYLDKRGIVIADGIVLGGNMRYNAIKEALRDPEFKKQAGVESENEIPAKWILDASDWTEEQKRRFVVIDNAPSGISGDWDWDALANMFDNEELTELGFNEGELGDLQPAEPEENAENKQSQINETESKYVKCPNCEHIFDSRDSEGH